MTHTEDIWHCANCGNVQGRHDMWFEGGYCGKCFDNKLTKTELESLKVVMLRESFRIKKEFSLTKISGGFCNITFLSSDADQIVCKIAVGSADESGRYVTEGLLLIDRETKEIVEDYSN